MTMYDSVSDNYPAGANLIAVYIDGRYANETSSRARDPQARLITTTVTGAHSADFIDCENGDATPAQAVAWSKAERAAGRRGGIYANLSTWPTINSLYGDTTGLERWLASYDGDPTIPPGYVAKQYRSDNRANLDTSSVVAGWPDGIAPHPIVVVDNGWHYPPPTSGPQGPQGSPRPIPGQEPLMVQDFSLNTGNDGTAYIELPIPAGCSKILGGWVDVLDPSATPGHSHDFDLPGGQSLTHSGVVCAPVVGGAPGRLRVAGAIPSHFYTGHAIFG